MRVLSKQAVLVVPYMVLAKLSVLLKSSLSTVVERAVKATEFLRESIATGHPHVIFQTLDEVGNKPIVHTIKKFLILFHVTVFCTVIQSGIKV